MTGSRPFVEKDLEVSAENANFAMNEIICGHRERWREHEA
jgi:hypothetical protein